MNRILHLPFSSSSYRFHTLLRCRDKPFWLAGLYASPSTATTNFLRRYRTKKSKQQPWFYYGAVGIKLALRRLPPVCMASMGSINKLLSVEVFKGCTPYHPPGILCMMPGGICLQLISSLNQNALETDLFSGGKNPQDNLESPVRKIAA